MELLITLVAISLVAWLNYYLATQRGRNAVGWAIAGAVVGLFSTILLLILGTTDEKHTENAIKLHRAVNK